MGNSGKSLEEKKIASFHELPHKTAIKDGHFLFITMNTRRKLKNSIADFTQILFIVCSIVHGNLRIIQNSSNKNILKITLFYLLS